MSKIIITPLGTISPYCKGKMNCPGFMIEYKDTRILLDCGNGCTRLMKFPDDLKNLHVFITHYHKDHYGDLGALQYASFVYNNLDIIKIPINVYLPENDFDLSKKEILLNKEAYANYHPITKDMRYNIGDLKISFHNNNSHTIETFAIKIESTSHKIVYTSDVGTTNIEGIVEFSKNADLLICESSFLRKHNSNSKTHLQASYSAIIAKKANVRKLLLTHFWPEERKRHYLKEAKQIFKNVNVAREGKKIVFKE